MVHRIWGGMIVASVLFALLTGRVGPVSAAVFDGAKQAVQVALILLAFMTFWLGILKIAEAVGLLRGLARLLSPLIRLLFPDVPKGHPAEGFILSNLSANFFGLGNAATPMGIKAMKELAKLNPRPGTASRPMITLLALNTASITLVPSTVIGYRAAYGSARPAEIIVPALIASTVGTVVALLVDRLFQRRAGDGPDGEG
ncbi:MAG: spore maturation protein [Hydrogenibacillus schlegelii]|nr:spore maturation protein [Hydrogenibacillus schlegelii]